MNGIINVYKEKGYTSHDVVAKLRSICRQKKIGHTGTLDPDAEGVLPVCLGTATKVCGLITDKDKEYEAVLLLGKETDTQDLSGKILNEAEVSCTEEEALKVISSFAGAYSQVPPMYSALKVHGKKLCDLAREGVEVAREPRLVQIYHIGTEWIRLPRIKLFVHCSKGTYIRTLCHDIGQELGCGGCMESLVRTRAGIFGIREAVKLPQVQELAEEGRLDKILMPTDSLFPDVPKASVAAGFAKMLQNGNRLPERAFILPGGERADAAGARMLRVYLDGMFYGIYEWDRERNDYKPLKIFA